MAHSFVCCQNIAIIHLNSVFLTFDNGCFYAKEVDVGEKQNLQLVRAVTFVSLTRFGDPSLGKAS